MLKYTELKEKPREFLAATGLTDEEFQCLLPQFETCYRQLSPSKPKTLKKKQKRRAAGGGRKSHLESLSDKLLFILVYQKTCPLQTMQALECGFESTADQPLDTSFVAGFAEGFQCHGDETGTRRTRKWRMASKPVKVEQT